MLEGFERLYLVSFTNPKAKSSVEGSGCIYEGVNIPRLIINYPNC